MLPNHIIRVEYERQNRSRIQQEAKKARLLSLVENKPEPLDHTPAWEYTLSMFRAIRLRLNPTG